MLYNPIDLGDSVPQTIHLLILMKLYNPIDLSGLYQVNKYLDIVYNYTKLKY